MPESPLAADHSSTTYDCNRWEGRHLDTIVRTIAYSDIFDCPLTPNEIYRYLETDGVSPLSIMRTAIGASGPDGILRRDGDMFALRGREEIFATRRRRQAISARQWPRARFWARLIWAVPYVRMVAVTGALAADNVESDGDIDYLLVTLPGHLWTARAGAVLLCRVAGLCGDHLCPNYLVTTASLRLGNESLYGARELAQMKVLHGGAVAQTLLAENGWHVDYLPNAGGRPDPPDDRSSWMLGALKHCGEALLATRLGLRFERWECRRKTTWLAGLSESDEEQYRPDICKGHNRRHAERTLAAFAARLERIAEGHEVQETSAVNGAERPNRRQRSVHSPA